MRVGREVLKFEWDRGNSGKNKKHRVHDNEAEEAFFDEQKIILEDILHSNKEHQYILLGKTKKGRLLFIVFTTRKEKLRIISARDTNQKEKIFMKKRLTIPKFKSEREERDFWSHIDLTKYYKPTDFTRVSFPNLKPTSTPISIRIPIYLLNRIKERANALHVPYQSLIKEYIHKGITSRK